MSPSPLIQVLAVGVGAAVGATCRHAVGLAVAGRRSLVAVNVAGSFLLGAILAAPINSTVALTAGTGFCGAFTTFSSFAVETVTTAGSGERRLAASFAAGVLLAGVAAAMAGAMAGAWLVTAGG